MLVPLGWDLEGELTCWMTLRPSSLQHGGEICFPGGKPQPEDLSLQHTALREAREELGLRRVQILGQLSSMPVYTSDYRLSPTVGWCLAEELDPDPAEVERVYALHPQRWLEREELPSLPFDWDGEEHRSPLFPMEDGRVLYGSSAYTFLETLEVLARAWGRSLPPLGTCQLDWDEVLTDWAHRALGEGHGGPQSGLQ